MKKKIFIMISLIIIFITLSILVFIQLNNLRNRKDDLAIQIEQLYSNQILDIKDDIGTDSSIEATASSSTNLDDIREKDILVY